jgi:hypothetical protein
MDSEVTKTDLHLQELKEPKEETPSSKPQITTDLPLQEPKDLCNSKIEEVRVESVDVNTQTVTDDAKPKTTFSFSLVNALLYVRDKTLYFTSCSSKNKPQTHNEPK